MTEYRGTSDYVMQVGAWRAGPRVVRQKTYPNLADFKMMALRLMLGRKQLDVCKYLVLIQPSRKGGSNISSVCQFDDRGSLYHRKVNIKHDRS